MCIGVVILIFLICAFVFVMLKHKEQIKILEELEWYMELFWLDLAL